MATAARVIRFAPRQLGTHRKPWSSPMRCTLAFVVLLISTLYIGAKPAAAERSDWSSRQLVAPSAEVLTDELAALNARLSTAAPAERARLEHSLAEVARLRRALLETLIQDEPETVLRAALSATDRARLPGSVRRHVEAAVQEEGELEVLIDDRVMGSQMHH